MNDKPDPLSGIEHVPWHRLVHFYGRASDIPPAIRELGSPGREEAIRHLRGCLEHQDGIIQATPFAVRFILQMRGENPDGVQTILEPVVAAAQFTLKNAVAPLAQVSWEKCLHERRLWPEFISELDDQNLWEQWEPEPEEWVAWSILTLREVAQATSPKGQ
jgi:hypothetical protein